METCSQLGPSSIVAGADDWPAGSSDRAVHRHHVAIYYSRGGCYVGSDPAARFDAEAGDVVLLRPTVLHQWTTRGHPLGQRRGLQAHYCLFDPPRQWESSLNFPQVIPHYSRIRFHHRSLSQDAGRAMARMVTLSAIPTPQAARLLFNLLEQVWLLCRLDQGEPERSTDGRIDAACRYIAEHLDQRITVDEIAQACHLSRAQFALLFRQQTGEPPMRYVENLRLQKAKALLEHSGWKIEVIARMTGFCDANYFANRFHRATGCSPNLWRSHPERRLGG